MKLKFILLFISLSFKLLFSHTDLQNVHFTKEEKEWILNNKIITFTGDPNWMPYESFNKDGKYEGIVADYLKIIEQKSGLVFDAQKTNTWSESLEKAVKGEVDVISGDAADEILNKKFNPVKPYSHNPIVLVMAKNKNYVDDLNTIKDKKIAIIKDYGYTADIFKTYPDIKFIEVNNIQEALEGVSDGHFDAMLGTLALASYHITNMQLHNLKIVGKTPIVMDLTLFISKDKPVLSSIIEKIFLSIPQKDHHKIINNWIEGNYIEKTDYTVLFQVVSVLLFIIIMIVVSNRRMKAEIEKREKLQFSLQEKDKELQLIFDNTQSGLMYVSGDRVLIKANRMLADILGYDSADEMIGLSMRELHLNQERFSEFGKNYADELKNGITKNIQYQLKRKDTTPIWCELTGKTIDSMVPADISKGVMWTVHDISIRKSFEEKLKSSEVRYRTLFEGNLAIELIVDPTSKKILDANESASKFYGYPLDKLKGMPINNINTMTLQEIEREMQNSKEKKKNTFHFKHRLSNGEIRDVEVYSGPIEINEHTYLYSIIFDITEQVKLENESIEAHKELEKQHEFLQTVIDSVSDAIMVIGTDYTISMMNETAKNMQMSKIVEDLNKPKCHEVSHHSSEPCDGESHPCPLKEVQISKKREKVLHEHINKNGETRIVEISATPLFNEDGEVMSIIESAHDVTELIHAQTDLRHQAEHDSLTDLPNRFLFLDRLNQAIKYAKRSNEKIGVLFLDLDHFKEINDSLGHSAGDELLKIVSSRLIEAVRQSDTVARLGGDEFAIIVDHISSTQSVYHVLESISAHLKEPYILEEHQIYVTPSIGASIYPDDALEADVLLKNADAAMYKAKNNGRNNYQFFTEDMTERAFERMVLETQLRQSLKLEQMKVYYQIQVDAKSNSILGMEALIRWIHPDMGVVSPSKFLSLAEDTGFIIELDEWVMDQSMKEYKQWYKDGFKPGVLSLNLTPQRLEQESFIEKLKDALKKHKFDTSWLLLEVTESQIMKNPHKAIKTLREVSDLGIRIAIDDFGTGYSSLSYLKQLPINKLKIDQSFVKDLPDDNDDAEITNTIISMAKSLGLSVIAEGVENEQQKEFLIKHGCSEIQGFLYHKPSTSDDIKAYLIKN